MSHSSSRSAFLPLLLIPAVLATGSRPLEAAREWDGPQVRGSYYGSLISSGGHYVPADLHLATQDRGRVGGWLVLRHAAPEVSLTGTVSRSGRISLTGRGGSGPGAYQIRIRADYDVDPEGSTGSIQGEYRVSGRSPQMGTFSASGLRNGTR